MRLRMRALTAPVGKLAGKDKPHRFAPQVGERVQYVGQCDARRVEHGAGGIVTRRRGLGCATVRLDDGRDVNMRIVELLFVDRHKPAE